MCACARVFYIVNGLYTVLDPRRGVDYILADSKACHPRGLTTITPSKHCVLRVDASRPGVPYLVLCANRISTSWKETRSLILAMYAATLAFRCQRSTVVGRSLSGHHRVTNVTSKGYTTNHGPELLSQSLDTKRRDVPRADSIGPFQLGIGQSTLRKGEKPRKWSELSAGGKGKFRLLLNFPRATSIPQCCAPLLGRQILPSFYLARDCLPFLYTPSPPNCSPKIHLLFYTVMLANESRLLQRHVGSLSMR